MEKAELSSTKRQLLEQWLRGNDGRKPFLIPKRDNIHDIPVSFTQQRQLFLELLRPGTAVNNLSICIEFIGHLDVSTVERSANYILSRHEILRTRFSFEHGMPGAEIVNEVAIQLSVRAIKKSNSGADSENITQLAEEIARQPFDLTRAPLINLSLFRVHHQKHVLVMVVHHSIADAWSLGIFLEELIHVYRRLVVEETIDLPKLPLQHADYVCWQNSHVKTEPVRSQLTYWSKQLEGSLPVLELPTDGSRQSNRTFAGSIIRFDIHEDTISRLEVMAQREDATLFMVMLAAYFTLLNRYSGQEDIVVGVPVSGRQSAEVMTMIGPFINVLPLRLKISEKSTFRQVIRQVRTIALEAFSHQEIPFEMIVEKIKPKRELSHSPIFQTVFNMRNAPMPKLDMPGLDLKIYDVNRGASEFDLSLMMVVHSKGICEAVLEYNRDLFQFSTIKRIARAFENLLNEAMDLADDPLSTLHFRSEEPIEAGETLQVVNFPRETCAYSLFEDQALKSPDSVAVKFGDKELTYAEVNFAANAICRLLRRKGIQPEDRIGVCMERCLEVVPALLGIQKAACTYVPIHPSFPTERIDFIVRDANIKLVLANVGLLIEGVEVLKAGEGEPLWLDDRTPIQPSSTPAGALAYIIYTSGSTGNPKGVMVPHTALTNLLWSMRASPGITPSDVLLSVTSISFDIAALEIFLPLITGATVVIASKEMITDPNKMADAIDRQNVSILQATPATWQMLIDSGWKGNLRLKALCGGESLSRRLADKLIQLTGETWNMYGPTETTIWSTISKISKDSVVSVGRPINNTKTFILDNNLFSVPRGAFGELCIGGEGLATGYVNNPVLTEQKFVNYKYGNGEAIKLFRTGDKARYLPDQSIELAGRLDDQVKVYGHRIDLNEVTAALLEHSAISGGIVLSKSENGITNLIAYYVSDHKNVSNDSLKDFLRSKIPGYMVPSFYVRVPIMPLTPNGKINRAALPAPEITRIEIDYVAPRTDLEKILVEIWLEILGTSPIGVRDDFFSLGGASIQSIQIVSAARIRGLSLTPEDIFECQTIEQLAARVSGS